MGSAGMTVLRCLRIACSTSADFISVAFCSLLFPHSSCSFYWRTGPGLACAQTCPCKRIMWLNYRSVCQPPAIQQSSATSLSCPLQNPISPGLGELSMGMLSAGMPSTLRMPNMHATADRAFLLAAQDAQSAAASSGKGQPRISKRPRPSSGRPPRQVAKVQQSANPARHPADPGKSNNECSVFLEVQGS